MPKKPLESFYLVHFQNLSGRGWDAERVCSEMQDRNVVSWTSMLMGYLLRGLYDESVKLHLQMQVEGVKPNPFTFATILGALADSGVVVKEKLDKKAIMQRPPLFEANCFIYWKNHFETYVKSKDVDLWYIIAHGNYKPTIKDKDSKDVVTPYEKLYENQKKMLSKNDEAKMVLYNALPKKEYERIFMSDTAQDIWDSLITTHQALPSKWRPKVTAIEESKDLSKLSLDELVGNLKVYEVVLEKDLEIAKNKKEKYKSLALKAKQVLSDDDSSSSDSIMWNIAMSRGPSSLYPKALSLKEDKKEERRCFKCGDPNHFISDCPKNVYGDQKAFVVESWSDSGDDSKKKEICLMAHSNEVRQKVKLDPDKWIQDSGCTRHMTGNKDLFSSYKPFDGGNVLFGSNTKSKIISKELLHMDLFGPSAVQSYGGNFYTLVIVDDYSRYTWTRFLKHKNEAFDHFEILSKKIQNQKGCPIISIHTDHGREFDNEVQFGAFCDANGITHNFSAPRTPQSNGVVERKNRTLQEMSRTLLNEQSIPQKFWCNAVDTSTYILNRILIRHFLEKTPYELFKGRKPNLEHFKVFGSKCFILNTKDYLTKFDPKSSEGVFLGYSPNSKAYVVLNKETMKVEESLNVKFDETPPPSSPPLVDDDLLEVDIIENQSKDLEVKENEPLNKQISNIKESKDHPLETVIGNLNQRTLRSQVQK
ncbi:retrovirus-related pol polyprotein from transposon TNT 1-94 [Tanacetum coccineum]